MNSITEEDGKEVDIYVTSVDNGSTIQWLGGNQGATIFRYEPATKAVKSEFGKFSISIMLDLETATTKTVRHKFGHTEYQIQNAEVYHNFVEAMRLKYPDTFKKEFNGGHSTNDLSGQKAGQYEKITDIK